MPVAVRLVELLALITVLGVVASFSIFAVAAQRLVHLLDYITTVTLNINLISKILQMLNINLSIELNIFFFLSR